MAVAAGPLVMAWRAAVEILSFCAGAADMLWRVGGIGLRGVGLRGVLFWVKVRSCGTKEGI